MFTSNEDVARAILKVLENKSVAGELALIEVTAVLEQFRQEQRNDAYREGYDDAFDEAYLTGYDNGCTDTEDRLKDEE